MGLCLAKIPSGAICAWIFVREQSNIRAVAPRWNLLIGFWISKGGFAKADWVYRYITSCIGRNNFSSRRPGVGSGSQVIAVVQATQSWHGDDFARCI
jgi:hypothetical protein